MKKIYVLLITLFAFQCSDRSQKTITIINPIQVTSLETVRNGIDILIEDYPNFLHGKAVGLVTNHTGITRHERKNYEVFKENPNITHKNFCT